MGAPLPRGPKGLCIVQIADCMVMKEINYAYCLYYPEYHMHVAHSKMVVHRLWGNICGTLRNFLYSLLL